MNQNLFPTEGATALFWNQKLWTQASGAIEMRLAYKVRTPLLKLVCEEEE